MSETSGYDYTKCIFVNKDIEWIACELNCTQQVINM